MQTRLSRQGTRCSAPVVLAVGAFVTAVAMAGCSSSGSGDDDSGGTSAASAPRAAAGAAAIPNADGAAGSGSDLASGLDSAGSDGQSGAASATSIVAGPALIKTAAVDLKSDHIQSIVDRVYALALTMGGRVDSEQTSTDADGTVDHSRVQLRVPVARFDEAVTRIYDFAPDHQKQTSTQDVTARLADVTSRVASARASIAQLRTLYDRATALGQVIRLERELSSREADLEALQAQQRSLSAEASMSTIQVSVTLPPPSAAPKHPTDDHQAGFVSGVKKGWDAMVAFVVGASHLLGLALPLGALAAIAAAVGWALYRRFSPRGPASPQPSE